MPRDSIGSFRIHGESIGLRWDTCAWRSVPWMSRVSVRWAMVESDSATELNNHEGGDNCGGSGPSLCPSLPSPTPSSTLGL